MEWTQILPAASVTMNALVLAIWKPWANAYAGEKGKNFARKEDLAQIVTEMQAVAAAQPHASGPSPTERWAMSAEARLMAKPA